MQHRPKRLYAAIIALAGGIFAVFNATAQNGRINKICEDCIVEKFASCEDKHFLEGPAFDKQGNLWATGLVTGAVLRVAPSGQCEVVKKLGGAINGSKFNHQGQLILTDVDKGLLQFDVHSLSAKVLRTKYGREVFRGINDSVIDKSGGIYFTESWGSNALKADGRVFYLPAEGIEDPSVDVKLVATGFAFPNGIVLSSNEKDLYVGEYAKNQIIKLQLSAPGIVAPRSVPYVFARLVGGAGPDGMALDTQGNLYAAHFFAGEVVVIDKDGFPYGSIKLPPGAGMGATNLAFHNGYLYITEAYKNEIWRVKIKFNLLTPPNLR